MTFASMGCRLLTVGYKTLMRWRAKHSVSPTVVESETKAFYLISGGLLDFSRQRLGSDGKRNIMFDVYLHVLRHG